MDRDLLKQKSHILADVSHEKARHGQGLRVHYRGEHIGYLKESEGPAGGYCCFDTGHVYLNLYSRTIEKATLMLVEWHQDQQSR
jgi:hypothetical protein